MRWSAWFWLLAPFAALVSVVELLVVALAYDPVAWYFERGRIDVVCGRRPNGQTRIWGNPGGQNWGTPITAYASDLQRASPPLVAHELTHGAHGLIVNAIAHAVLVGPALALSAPTWLLVASALAAQLAFALSYFGHWLIEYATGPSREDIERARRVWGARPGTWPWWFVAYCGIWTERIAERYGAMFEGLALP